MNVIQMLFALCVVGILADMVNKIAKAKMSGRGASPRELADLREQLEATQAALANQEQQVLELQERADFMERMLAQTRDQARVGDGFKQG